MSTSEARPSEAARVPQMRPRQNLQGEGRLGGDQGQDAQGRRDPLRGPVYYGTINALGHAFLERTFSLRHRASFALTGKPNAILTVGTEEPNPAEDFIKSIFRSNYMAAPIGTLRAKGIAQCYTCGFGEGCSAGAVVSRHGFLDEIKGYHIPRIPQKTYRKATTFARSLGSVLRNNA